MSTENTQSHVCSICLTAVEPGGGSVECPSCTTVYHDDCWAENGGCGRYGCVETPPTEPRTDLEIPVSFWGQEHKQCPSCGTQIMAAALRCRNCGATFSSARPEDAEAFRNRATQQSRRSGTQRMAMVVFSLCILPCTSPLGLLIAAIWYPLRRKELATLPGLYRTLLIIGMIVAVILIVGTVLLSLTYARTHTLDFELLPNASQ
ncbi:RING finger protein [Roseimicrobium sp. ORNL1]|uniref:RING finger protein n=1 Tax=Roseimicrobium sp. ORNL1 TaxID=2711231 RepID=UPI0013E18663|nr:RING finger protein [Roseimicrobium sp. ORNL1]QIF02704.1 hypothetical protein G5S37_14625 [Roseimicrobium sp. ORNL1]